jgi:hypothetical protein
VAEAVLSDPKRSQAVLVGVHRYSGLENLPAVAANLEGLRRALTDPAVWGLPWDACTVLPQPSSAGEVLDAVRERGRLAEDTLFVYYAGHGLTDPFTDELYLALPGSDPDREYTSLRYEYLRRAVRDPLARARRTVVVLDCCYSGRAMTGWMNASAHIADQTAVDGSCLITACAETRTSLSPPGETYTAFTGELVTALVDGVPGGPDLLDMDSLFQHLLRSLSSKSRPLPQQRNRNTGGLIAIARNRATLGAAVLDGAGAAALGAAALGGAALGGAALGGAGPARARDMSWESFVGRRRELAKVATVMRRRVEQLRRVAA